MAHIKPLFGLITSFRMRLSQKIFFLLNLLVFLHAQESKTNPTKENDVKDQSVNAKVSYNSKIVEANIDYSERNEIGIINVQTDHFNKGFDFTNDIMNNGLDEVRNELDLSVSRDIPVQFDIDFGMGEANIDLTDLSISRVNIECGLGKMNINIDSPNPVTCDFLIVDTGMGEFSAEGLSNLNTRKIDIEVGLGEANIDFTGDIKKDTEIDVEVGLGTLNLLLSNNVNVKAKVDQSFLSSIELDDLVKKDKYYLTKNWDYDRPTVYLDISVGLGSVKINLQ